MRVALFLVALIVAVGGGLAVWRFSTPDSSLSALPSPSPAITQNTPSPALSAVAPASKPAPPVPQAQRPPAPAVPREAKPGEPVSLAKSLPAGQRALSIASESLRGLTDVIVPGDRVDILVTTHGKPGAPPVTATLLPYAHVLALKNTEPPSIIIAVLPDTAQQIQLAEEVGTLSVLLRSYGERPRQSPPPLVGSPFLQPPSKDGDVRIIRGVDSSKRDDAGRGME